MDTLTGISEHKKYIVFTLEYLSPGEETGLVFHSAHEIYEAARQTVTFLAKYNRLQSVILEGFFFGAEEINKYK